MRLFFHYCPGGFSNCYLLGTDITREKSDPGEAIIIDPGIMDINMLKVLEDNNYTLRAVLITHDHPHHVHGLKTLMKIYNTEIFAINPLINDHKSTLVKDGDILKTGPFKTEVISIPGHSADSAVFKIDRLLFTGDSLMAGYMGSTASLYAAATQVNALRSKIFSLPGDYTLLPGHGPPSSLEAERRFYMDVNTFEINKNRRPAFSLEY